MTPSMGDLKAYMPAKDFELSKQFCVALGFNMSEGWGGTADFELNGSRFGLQDYYVNDWANNFMVVMGVEDVRVWQEKAREVIGTGQFGMARVAELETVDDSLVLHVWDPSGVLLVFVQ